VQEHSNSLPAAGAQAAVLDKPWIIYPGTYRAYPVLDKADNSTIRGDRAYPVLRLYYPKLACQAGVIRFLGVVACYFAAFDRQNRRSAGSFAVL
jgi:hypothetical protein